MNKQFNNVTQPKRQGLSDSLTENGWKILKAHHASQSTIVSDFSMVV